MSLRNLVISEPKKRSINKQVFESIVGKNWYLDNGKTFNEANYQGGLAVAMCLNFLKHGNNDLRVLSKRLGISVKELKIPMKRLKKNGIFMKGKLCMEDPTSIIEWALLANVGSGYIARRAS